MESSRGPQRVWFHFVHSTVENRKNKKTFKNFWREKWGIQQERTWEFHLHSQQDQDFSTTSGAAQLITQMSSQVRSVDLTNNGMGNHYLRDVDHGSTLSYTTQDRIFHVRLDIWRCRTTRINVRLNSTHRKSTNSNGNQVCRVFSRTQWELILFVCYETRGFDLDPNITQSCDDRHGDTWSVESCFFWKHRYSIEKMWKFLWIGGNKDLTKIVIFHNLCVFEIHKDCDFAK
jgi:hypothetical protein